MKIPVLIKKAKKILFSLSYEQRFKSEARDFYVRDESHLPSSECITVLKNSKDTPYRDVREYQY